ncbi:50S ribosomal protein L11 methyltransferase [Aquihabitans daechungensis]|uniref:50S ribosomal protein L11 methyltransferase n=1 Tax=Aquihabitans daechungensis TaxID=1052257 RepID=UPI003BA09875
MGARDHRRRSRAGSDLRRGRVRRAVDLRGRRGRGTGGRRPRAPDRWFRRCRRRCRRARPGRRAGPRRRLVAHHGRRPRRLAAVGGTRARRPVLDHPALGRCAGARNRRRGAVDRSRPDVRLGSHPTTRLVLALLQDLVGSETTMLDAGCGSGVLAIGAARCGAASIVATDIDPAAPAVVTGNAERNGVGDRVQTTTDPIGALAAAGSQFSVVAANLLAPVIADVGPDLVRCVAPGGSLVVSGLLADRWEASLPAVAPLTAGRVAEEQGWVAVVLR